ncbi:hypothetical protein [Bradyrhizobium erythrophlei]|uniref:Uncharacterized protein n=1 Tax=Bradyrhizobium erythrophlei TaxID=1437360 RepID=A0A1M5S1C5_9BRAD|nr:hypothetical protein [Bradyrhizobium erythrophlei]SHH32264.1 hypothetical protein SAMN05444169_6887 [Bradyrhizobium erythrophlei]
MLAIRAADFDRLDVNGGPPCAVRWANSLSRNGSSVADIVARMKARQAMQARQSAALDRQIECDD